MMVLSVPFLDVLLVEAVLFGTIGVAFGFADF
jgi:hypothetical protein